MRRNYSICCLVLCAVLFGGGSRAYCDDGRQTIGSIMTAGNLTISSAKILTRVRSREGEVFDSTTVDEDTKRIAGIEGISYCYYSADVSDGKVGLTFVVIEKKIVRSIYFTGNYKYKDSKLRKKAGLKKGEYFDPVQAEAGRKEIEDYYRKKGFAFASVSLDEAKLAESKVVYAIDEGPRVKIASVEFSGNEALTTSALKGVVKTKKKRFFFWPAYYDEEKWDTDIVKLANIYQKRGFLDAGIQQKREFNGDKSRVRLTFQINEGAVYTINQVVFGGNEYFSLDKLEQQLRLEIGQVYSDDRAQMDVKRVRKLYLESGFIDASVKYDRKFVSENQVDVEFRITEGERFRIGQIQISGNKDTQGKVIRRVLDELDFVPGNWYNAEIAHGDGGGSGYLEKMIRRTIYAENASITATGNAVGQRDALVHVTEGQTGSVMLGAGVASDSGLIGQLVFEQRNFDISNSPENFTEFITGKAFKGAGQSLRIALQPGTEVSEYSVNFREPYFYNKPISLDVIGSSYERGQESYDEKRTKGYVGFEKRYKNRWRRSVSFRLENVDLDSLDTDAPQEIVDDKDNNLMVGIKLGVGRDLTNDRFNPSSGYTFNASYEQVTGDHTFGVLSGTCRWYRTVYEDLAERKTILATKLYAATLIGDGPVFEKFYAGGQGSIRGFDYRGVSTRGLQRNVANPERDDPIGSDWVFLANAEVLVPLVSENVGLLFFVDSGLIDTGGYRAAIGTGIQILIPQWFGPVPMRFELGIPVAKSSDDETQVFSFSVGRLF